MMKLSFSKYSGCGNDFVLIDNRSGLFALSPEEITRLCHRQLGIGADGFISLENSKSADFRMRIFNADGSEAEMCGNGIRCLAKFIQELGVQGDSFVIETMWQNIPVRLFDHRVSVEMPPPAESAFDQSLMIHGQNLPYHFLDTGVPHAVFFVDDIDNDDYLELAPAIRFHPRFQPKGTNVNFVKIISDCMIAVRTYERGVEKETLACGTGAVAASLAACEIHALKRPIAVMTRSNEVITINFSGSLQNLRSLEMSGPAIKTFQGIFN